MKITLKILYITLITYPFYYILQLPNLEVANPYYLGISLLFILAMAKLLFSKESYNVNLLDFSLIAFILCFFVSTLLSDTQFRSSYLAFRAIFIPISTYFIIKSFIQSEKEFQTIFKAVFIGTAIFSIIGLAVALTIATRGRIIGHPPVAASNLAVITFVIIMFTDYKKTLLGKITAVIALALIFSTFSRMSYLTVILSPFIMRSIRRGHLNKFFLFLFPILLAFVILLPLNKGLLRHTYVPTSKLATFSRITNISFYKRALLDRAAQYETGLALFRQAPVLGHGIKELNSTLITLHCFHLEWLAYGGVIGYFFAFSSFIVFCILQRKVVVEDKWAALSTCIVIVTLFNSFTNGIMHGIRPDLIYMFMGFTEARRQILKNSPTENRVLLENK